MPNQWDRYGGARNAYESGSGNQSNSSLYQGHNMEKLLRELEQVKKLEAELRQKLEKAEADLNGWQTWRESEQLAWRQQLEEATAKSGIKLQEADKTIELLESKCAELEETNRALYLSKQDEIKKYNALASTLEREQKMFERIMSVWKQRVTSLQADLDNSEKECGRAQAELFKKHVRQQKSHHTTTITNINNPLDTSDIRNNNTPDTSDVPSPRKKLAKTSEKSHDLTKSKNRQIDEIVSTQRKDKPADRRHHTQVNRLIQIEYFQNASKRKTILNRRTLVNSNRHPAKCKLCNSFFVSKNTLKTHMRRIHLRESNFSCDFCDRTFLWRHELALHRTKHTGELPYSCESCPKKFRTNSQLKLHNMKHLKERPYACKLCPKRFKQRPVLNRHMQSHTEERRYACGLCPKKFHSESQLNYHRTLHEGQDPYKCEFCPRIYITPRSRARHEQNIHPDLLPYQCKICALGFRSRSSQQRHRKTCSVGERPYKCSVCTRKFKLSSSLTIHEKAHSTNEPAYQCKECGRRFYEKRYLNMHQRCHLK